MNHRMDRRSACQVRSLYLRTCIPRVTESKVSTLSRTLNHSYNLQFLIRVSYTLMLLYNGNGPRLKLAKFKVET